MYEQKVTINNPSGIHARPAAKLVKLAEQFECDLTISYDTVECDPKSIFSLLSADLHTGLTVVIRGSGADEKTAVDSICRFIDLLEE